MSYHYRRMLPADLAAVLAVQAAAYPPAFNEDAATFGQRLAAAPECAWVAEGTGGICAYLVGYRSQLGKITPLGGDFSPQPVGNCLYLHDLAVNPHVAGNGIGIKLVETAWFSAGQTGLSHSALVALPAASAFWLRLGYQPHNALDSAQQAHLASYPDNVSYMVKTLSNPLPARAGGYR